MESRAIYGMFRLHCDVKPYMACFDIHVTYSICGT